MKPRDFRHRKHYPGLTGNPFDRVLHRALRLERVPAPLIFLLLTLLAALASLGRWQAALIYALAFYIDYLLLALLPETRISYGPVKPPALMLACLRLLFFWLPIYPLLLIQGVGTLLVIYGFYIEPHHLQISYQRYPISGQSGAAPVRIAHLSDLHIERLSFREEKVLQKLEEIRPDAILITGDLLNLSFLEDPTAIQDARAFLTRLHAPEGVFFVSGSPVVDLPDLVPAILNGLPLIWLKHEAKTLHINGQELTLIGISCSHKPEDDFRDLKSVIPEKKRGTQILLYHSPDLAPLSARLPVDLQLSGHTHGGQVRLPFIGALFTGSLYGRAFQAGRYLIGNTTLYISRGLGLEGAAAPRVRFLCPPEIILWEIFPASKQEHGIAE